MPTNFFSLQNPLPKIKKLWNTWSHHHQVIYSTCLVTGSTTRSRPIGVGIAVPAQIVIILAAGSAIEVMERRVPRRESKLEAVEWLPSTISRALFDLFPWADSLLTPIRLPFLMEFRRLSCYFGSLLGVPFYFLRIIASPSHCLR
jgi:hypothetical protein